ncbi:uncharacterized protein LOC135222601 isoform X2 [Macrobrachium nipponense]|uniref:uncharacterized protein LOC135222601 isoform X2 n=1 Tax=Macrobrachium nipponense TaxID=159736 RepID=UPI0030C8C470
MAAGRTMGEPRFVFKSCCFGISLRRAACIIAGVSLFLQVIGLAGGMFIGIKYGLEEGWMNVVIKLMNIALILALIYAIKTTRQDLVFLWVYGSLMMTILSLAIGIISVVYTKTAVGSVILVTLIALHLYFIVVIRSYAHSMNDAPIILQQSVSA